VECSVVQGLKRGRLRAVNPHDAVAAAFYGRSVEEGITLMRERAEGR
jgi:hypothetical protein